MGGADGDEGVASLDGGVAAAGADGDGWSVGVGLAHFLREEGKREVGQEEGRGEQGEQEEGEAWQRKGEWQGWREQERG